MISHLRNKYLGQVLLSVGRYKNRLRGADRGHDITGIRLDCHHTPHTGLTAIEREEGVAVAIPEDVHKWLHYVRDRHVGREKLKDVVENDFLAMWQTLKERGCTDDLIVESMGLVHEKNQRVKWRNPYTGEVKMVNLYDDDYKVKGRKS